MSSSEPPLLPKPPGGSNGKGWNGAIERVAVPQHMQPHQQGAKVILIQNTPSQPMQQVYLLQSATSNAGGQQPVR